MEVKSLNIIETKRIEIDENFTQQLTKFVDLLENKEVFDKELYSSLLDYQINEYEFKRMIETIRLFAFDDEDKDEINFPYEEWIDRLTSWWIIEKRSTNNGEINF